MLGTAARNSIEVESGPASHLGVNSETDTEMPRPIGTTMSMATNVVMTVPTTSVPPA